MCGIVGIINFESDMDLKLRSKVNRILFTELMRYTIERGEDATGIYQVNNGDWSAVKTSYSSIDFMFGRGMEHYKKMLQQWEEGPDFPEIIVGHCRKATVGSKGEDNNDNHPFAIPVGDKHAILGIHNGTLHNHHKIYSNLEKMLGKKIPRQGSVDSESIFWLLACLTKGGQEEMTKEHLKELAARLDGAYATIMTNTRFPSVAVIKKDRPVYVYRVKEINSLVIVSDNYFMNRATNTYCMIKNYLDSSLPSLKLDNPTKLSDYQGLIIDLEAKFDKPIEVFDLPRTVNSDWREYYNDSSWWSREGAYSTGKWSGKRTYYSSKPVSPTYASSNKIKREENKTTINLFGHKAIIKEEDAPSATLINDLDKELTGYALGWTDSAKSSGNEDSITLEHDFGRYIAMEAPRYVLATAAARLGFSVAKNLLKNKASGEGSGYSKLKRKIEDLNEEINSLTEQSLGAEEAVSFLLGIIRHLEGEEIVDYVTTSYDTDWSRAIQFISEVYDYEKIDQAADYVSTLVDVHDTEEA